MKFRLSIYILFAFISLFILPLLAQISENEIKTVYIEKFTRFVEWPESLAIADTTQPFIFGILGEGDIYNTMKKIYKNKTIRNKKVLLVQYNSAADIQDCHLLFIDRSKRKSIRKILNQIQHLPILIIGDTEGFAQKGVHINFYTEGKNVLFEINPDAVKKSQLYMSHHLMRAGKIVRSE